MQQGMQATIGIRRRVSLVVVMLDALRDTPVNGARAVIEPKYCDAVVKPDGFHIFVNLPMDKLRLTAKAPGYRTMEMEIDISTLDPLEPIVRLRLAPQRADAAAWVTGRVTGKGGAALPYADVRLYGTDVYKILADLSPGEEHLDVFNPSGRYLGGSLFLLQDGEGEQTVRLLDKGERGYLMEKPIERRVQRMPARLIRIYETAADENGEYRWPFLLQEGEPCNVTVQALYAGEEGSVSGEARMGELTDMPQITLKAAPLAGAQGTAGEASR